MISLLLIQDMIKVKLKMIKFMNIIKIMMNLLIFIKLLLILQTQNQDKSLLIMNKLNPSMFKEAVLK
jgi:hypothetical protein